MFMRINELLRNPPSGKKIQKLLMKPYLIKASTDVGELRVSTDDLIFNLINYSWDNDKQPQLHPVYLLGVLTNGDTVKQVLQSKQVQHAFKVIDNAEGTKSVPSGLFNPLTFEISLSKACAEQYSIAKRYSVMRHELGHRGLACAGGTRQIVKHIKGISKRPFTKPFHAWGAHPDSRKQGALSEKRFDDTQYATLEHLMLYQQENNRRVYSYPGKRDDKGRVKPTYKNNSSREDKDLVYNPELWQSVPGFEELQTVDEAFTQAGIIFDIIGDGILSFIAEIAREVSKISQNDMDTILYNFMKKQGY
jgi:hypothetical protein